MLEKKYNHIEVEKDKYDNYYLVFTNGYFEYRHNEFYLTSRDYKTLHLKSLFEKSGVMAVEVENGRVVRNQVLNKIINDAYSSFKEDTRYPIVVIKINYQNEVSYLLKQDWTMEIMAEELTEEAVLSLPEGERVYEVLTPDFMTFAEDMSYNKGPMLSEELFHDFIAPLYNKVIPVLHDHGTKVIMDSDGDISRMIPWMQKVGIDGVLPLERQAGVDVCALREKYPDFLFIGAFDKMTMRQSTNAMRSEFERLLPAMKTGGFIPSCHHQTPPDVPLERYKEYVALQFEYAEKAVK